MSGGREHTIALLGDNTVRSWGNNGLRPAAARRRRPRAGVRGPGQHGPARAGPASAGPEADAPTV
ncbi:RCC1-like domain-containing protein [Kitasatospora sp. NPDC088346]|uniref:RCC1-like domain-containing protein n=1 Tax=Kitasatospora sp. NPDC088346 TaxID=3364073 RepID=UPI00381B367C